MAGKRSNIGEKRKTAQCNLRQFQKLFEVHCYILLVDKWPRLTLRCLTWDEWDALDAAALICDLATVNGGFLQKSAFLQLFSRPVNH